MIKNLLLLCALFYFSQLYSQTQEITLISWNIRDFGKTKSAAELEKIATILKDADIIAIQEVVAGYGGAQAVAKLADLLNRKGAQWDYIISDPTRSSKYMLERYAYIWKNKHIKIKNRGRLISELQDKIEREPLAVDFYTKGKQFTIYNYHAIPNQKNPKPEITALTKYLVDNSDYPTIIAGDFNMDENDAVFYELIKNNYTPSLRNTKTTIKRTCNNLEYLNYNIDNIYISKRVTKKSAGVIDFVKVCDEIDNARKLSDHLPVFLKFSLH